MSDAHGAGTRASSRLRFDVWNEVPLVPQRTGMSCWAAAAAMLVGWRERLPVHPDEVASGAGRWGAYEQGLHPRDVETLARTFRLEIEPPRRWTLQQLRKRLEDVGPLWLGEASPGLHSIVITGIFGDGTPDGTMVRVNDPWPVGQGERYLLTFRALMRNLRAASALVGGTGQILHSGGRGHGASRSEFEWQHESTTSYGQGPVAAGQRFLASSSLPGDPLSGHAGSGENLFVCWNDVPGDATFVDVVLHFHGYSPRAPDRALLEAKARLAGLDFSRRSSPTLGIVPRGRKITTAEVRAERAAGRDVNPERYTFPTLLAGSGQGLERLIAEAVQWFSRSVLQRGGSAALPIRRLILTAHSGGGAPLNALLRHAGRCRVCDPHEVHVFDALYTQVDGLSAWAAERLRRHLNGPSPSTSGALRVVHRAGTGAGSRALMSALSQPLRGVPAAVARFYRVELTSVGHDDIPGYAGPALLSDASSDLPVRSHRPGARAHTVMDEALPATPGGGFGFPSEQSGERYGIPLGLFQYYAPSQERTRRPSPRTRLHGELTMSERPRSSEPGRAFRRRQRS